MKTLILVIPLALMGCNPPVPIAEESTTAITECLEKGWIPSYFSNGFKIQYDCRPPQ